MTTTRARKVAVPMQPAAESSERLATALCVSETHCTSVKVPPLSRCRQVSSERSVAPEHDTAPVAVTTVRPLETSDFNDADGVQVTELEPSPPPVPSPPPGEPHAHSNTPHNDKVRMIMRASLPAPAELIRHPPRTQYILRTRAAKAVSGEASVRASRERMVSPLRSPAAPIAALPERVVDKKCSALATTAPQMQDVLFQEFRNPAFTSCVEYLQGIAAAGSTPEATRLRPIIKRLPRLMLIGKTRFPTPETISDKATGSVLINRNSDYLRWRGIAGAQPHRPINLLVLTLNTNQDLLSALFLKYRECSCRGIQSHAVYGEHEIIHEKIGVKCRCVVDHQRNRRAVVGL